MFGLLDELGINQLQGALEMKYGKKAARFGAIPLKFFKYFSAADLPTPPLVFGRPDLIPDPGILGNDTHSNCVQVDFAHQTMYWHALAGTPIPVFNTDSVLADYSAQTGYNPAIPSTDTGTDMGEAAAYWQTKGITDANGLVHKIDYSTAISQGNVDELALAAYLFSSVSVGIELPTSAIDDFKNGTPWNTVSASKEGGHDVTLIGRNHHGNFLVWTWGKLQAVTPLFFRLVMDEASCHFSDEMLNAKALTYRGIDAVGLKAEAAELQ